MRYRTRALLAAVACTLLLTGTGTAVADDAAQRSNDIVFNDRPSGRGPDYYEVFKQEGRGHKNYLYTVTQVETPGGLFCTVITFASETAGSATCLPSVANPGVFRKLDPATYPAR